MSDCCNDKSDATSIAFDTNNLEELICYCFKYSKMQLYDATMEGRESLIITDIKKKMKDPGCFCETANPSKKCCLADIDAFIKSVKK